MSRLVPVHSAGNQHEAVLLREMLMASGIGCVIQGESTRTDMGTEAGFSDITLLVPASQLDDARALLQAEVVRDPAQSIGPRSIDGEICAVHEQPATGICGRCGNFLCASCGPVGEAMLCESCADRPIERKRTGTKVAAFILLAVLLGVPALIAVVVRVLMGS